MKTKKHIIDWLQTNTGLNVQSIYNFAKEVDELYKKELKEQLTLTDVGSSLPNKNTVISEIKKNLKEINEDKKVTNTDFDLGYSLGFFDGFDYNK